MYEDFEEFNVKIRPYYGRGNFSNNMELLNFILEEEEKEEED